MFKRRKPDDQTGDLPAELTDELTAPPVPEPRWLEPARRPTATADNGLGVPPFRPASKEAPMGRTPFPVSPSQGLPPVPAVPGQLPAAARAALAAGTRPLPVREPAERRTLVVGRGISLQGTVQDAERLVVDGTVEATMIHAAELSISHGGVFKGEIEVEDAEIAGTIDGTLTVRGNLIVRGSGRVLGTAKCRRLQVEDGGQITGRIEMMTDTPAPVQGPLPVRATEAAAE